MTIFQSIDKHFGRAVFFLAAASLCLAFAEAFVNLFGISLTSRIYTAGRLLELAAILLTFVIVQLLRQIRDTLRNR